MLKKNEEVNKSRLSNNDDVTGGKPDPERTIALGPAKEKETFL
jgi:hypothetical protein